MLAHNQSAAMEVSMTGPYTEELDQRFEYQITQVDEQGFEMQFNFSEPLSISTNQDSDYLHLQFISNETFVTGGTYYYLPND